MTDPQPPATRELREALGLILGLTEVKPPLGDPFRRILERIRDHAAAALSTTEPDPPDYRFGDERFMGRIIELWHDGKIEVEHLHDALGLTREQYAAWVECRPQPDPPSPQDQAVLDAAARRVVEARRALPFGDDEFVAALDALAAALSQEPEEPCPDCGGRGVVRRPGAPEAKGRLCSTCSGTGEEPKG